MVDESQPSLTFDQAKGAAGRRSLHLRDLAELPAESKQTLGEEMRTARLARGLDLAAVAEVLKIRKAHLDALESDNIRALPGRPYALGFVRSYAQFLGIDVEQCVTRLRAAFDREGLHPQFHFPDAAPEFRLPRGGWLMGGGAIAIMLLGMWMFSGSGNDEETGGTGVVAMLQQPTPTLNSGAASSTTKPVLSGDTAHARPAPPGTAEQASQAYLTDADAMNETSAISMTGGPQASASPDPAVSRSIVNVTPGPSLVLNALFDAWVRLEDGAGNVLISRTMTAGERFQVPPAARGLVLVTRDAGAVELIVNDYSHGTVGPRGRVLTGLALDLPALAAATPPSR
jgi:cytoskeleton protein RodZ